MFFILNHYLCEVVSISGFDVNLNGKENANHKLNQVIDQVNLITVILQLVHALE